MTNIKENLREEFQAWVESGVWQGEDEYTKNFGVGNVADWWLSKRDTELKTLLTIVEIMKVKSGNPQIADISNIIKTLIGE